MRMSRKATSGRASSKATSAAAPSPHSPTTGELGPQVRQRLAQLPAQQRFVIDDQGGGHLGDLARNDEQRFSAASRCAADREGGTALVEDLEPVAHIAQAHALPRLALRVEADAVVADSQHVWRYSSRARIHTRPGWSEGPTPWVMEFSTSVCSSSTGEGVSCSASGTAISKRSFSPSLICMMAR